MSSPGRIHFLCASFTGYLGGMAFNYANIITIRSLTGLDSGAGLVNVIPLLPFLLLSPYAGALAARISSKWLVILAQSGSLAAAILVLFATRSAGDAHFRSMAILASAFLSGICFAFVATPKLVLAKDLGGEGKTGAVPIMVGMTLVAAMGLAPPLIGFISQVWGADRIYLVPVICFGLSNLQLALVAHRTLPFHSDHSPFLAGLAYIRRDALMARLFLLMVCAAFLIGPFQVLVPQLLKSRFNLEEFHRGILLGSLSIGLLGGAVCAMVLRNRIPPESIAASGAMSGAVFLIAASAPAQAWAAAACLGASSFSVSLALNTILAALQNAAHPRYSGRIMGYYASLYVAVPAVSGLLMSFLSDASSIGIAVWISASIVLLSVAALMGFSAPASRGSARPEN